MSVRSFRLLLNQRPSAGALEKAPHYWGLVKPRDQSRQKYTQCMPESQRTICAPRAHVSCRIIVQPAPRSRKATTSHQHIASLQTPTGRQASVWGEVVTSKFSVLIASVSFRKDQYVCTTITPSFCSVRVHLPHRESECTAADSVRASCPAHASSCEAMLALSCVPWVHQCPGRTCRYLAPPPRQAR